MALSFWIFGAAAVALLAVLVWVLYEPRQGKEDRDFERAETLGRKHVTYFPQVRQALTEQDLQFLDLRGRPSLSRRLRKERRRIVLAYLAHLRSDFANLWRLARVIAAMSPVVGANQELARFRLGVAFYARYEFIRLQFICGFAPLAHLNALSQVVGNLAIQLETAMSNLGERAALATELASTLHGRGLDTP
jgi:hypothetical protein